MPLPLQLSCWCLPAPAGRLPAADQVEALISRLGQPTRIGQRGRYQSRLAEIAQKGQTNPGR